MSQGLNFFEELIQLILSVFSSTKEIANTNKSYEKTGYKYTDDIIHQAKSFASRQVKKNMAVIHFSWSKDLDSLSHYFSKLIPANIANSTWGVGKDGKVHRYLPDASYPAWTSNGMYNGQAIYARFIDILGRWKTGRYVNDHSVSFEIVNINFDPYTESQYIQVAKRLLWMLDSFDDFRLWRITGHEQLVPIAKNDPGAQWDWKKMFWMLGVKDDFYNKYLKYLDDTSYSTVGDESRTALKKSLITEAVNRIARDLTGKDKGYCL